MIELPKIELKKEPQEQDFDFKKIHDLQFVDIDEVLKPQPVAISIGTSKYKGQNYPIPFGSYGDFSCIVGASKSKKTFLKSLFTACYIGGNSNLFSTEIKGHNVGQKWIIDIDTEQSEFHAQRVFRRVAEMVGTNPINYKPFALRTLSATERLKFIDWIFNESKYKGNIGLLIIDGVADLVNDVNNLEQSNEVSQKLLEWSGNENCHIITVLHRNFGSNKPTGHLGSSVLKKAETVVFVEKDDDAVLVTSEYSRNQPFENFAFTIDENWLPCVINEAVTKQDIEIIFNQKNKPNF
jgi:hypothetical protein